MRKVIILGCPGSGKSTFGDKRQIHLPEHGTAAITWAMQGSYPRKQSYLLA